MNLNLFTLTRICGEQRREIEKGRGLNDAARKARGQSAAARQPIYLFCPANETSQNFFVLLAGQRAVTSGHCFQREKRRGRGHKNLVCPVRETYSVPASEDSQKVFVPLTR